MSVQLTVKQQDVLTSLIGRSLVGTTTGDNIEKILAPIVVGVSHTDGGEIVKLGDYEAGVSAKDLFTALVAGGVLRKTPTNYSIQPPLILSGLDACFKRRNGVLVLVLDKLELARAGFLDDAVVEAKAIKKRRVEEAVLRKYKRMMYA